MLCSVTARTIMVVRWSWLFGPSACKLFWCRCGMRWSSSSKTGRPAKSLPPPGKRQPAQICGLLHSRDQQAPHRCRHHDSGGKAGEGALDAVTQSVFKRTHSLPQGLYPERGSIPPRMRLVSCSTSLQLFMTNCIKVYCAPAKGQGLCGIEDTDRFPHRKIHLCKLSGFCLTTHGGSAIFTSRICFA